MDNKQNEELQSRREFFKKAAKAALPVVGAVILASVPSLAEAATGCHGCSGTCASSCGAGCSIGCGGYCSETCKGQCKGTCNGTCEYKCTRAGKY